MFLFIVCWKFEANILKYMICMFFWIGQRFICEVLRVSDGTTSKSYIVLSFDAGLCMTWLSIGHEQKASTKFRLMKL